MAQKISVILTDDLDGTEAHETISFVFDGTAYEIDLSTDNAAYFRETVQPFVEKARRVTGSQKATRGRKPKGDGPSPDVLRSWASQNGYEVSQRGRISETIRQAYAAAHGA